MCVCECVCVCVCVSVCVCVCVCTDHEANRLMLEALLRRRGYATARAADGRAAVDAAAARRYDAILMVRASAYPSLVSLLFLPRSSTSSPPPAPQ